jgi:peptidyl-prolyl cis-trans isomerase C
MGQPLFPDVVVNGETIASAAIAAEAQNHVVPKGKPGLAWRKAAQALAIRALMLQEANRRGVEAMPADLGPGRRETEEEARIRGLLEIALEVTPPSEDDVRAAWSRDPERFRSPPLWEASHILCAAEPGDDERAEAACRRATAMIAEIQRDPNQFARLAANESDCSSKSDGGFLGQLGPGDSVPEFEAALAQLGEGEMTPEPVRSRFGWHVIRLDARAEGRVLPYDAVRPHLVEAFEKTAWARAAQAFTRQLIATADIEGIEMKPF